MDLALKDNQGKLNRNSSLWSKIGGGFGGGSTMKFGAF
ncbi:hypothetical protein Trydic_g15992, partial [Trypoxylus dichotomus]